MGVVFGRSSKLGDGRATGVAGPDRVRGRAALLRRGDGERRADEAAAGGGRGREVVTEGMAEVLEEIIQQHLIGGEVVERYRLRPAD